MNPALALSGEHRRTYEKIFQNPASSDLEWHEVRTLLGEIGQTAMERSGNLKATRNGHTLVLPPPRTKVVTGTPEFREIRHFLEQSEVARPIVEETGAYCLVVINPEHALIFRLDLREDAPELIASAEPEKSFNRAHNPADFTDGQGSPAAVRFFEPVATALKPAGRILLFGTGTGRGSEMEQFAIWLEHHYPELARRITGKVAIDEPQATKSQLLAKAREFYGRTRHSAA
jgi:hypothetical protein